MNSSESIKSQAETKPRILILEDNELDVNLIENVIKNEYSDYVLKHTFIEFQYIESLEKFKPDIILSDFCLPTYDGFTALEEAKRYNDDVPFIFVSGAIGEDLAIEALKRGATDCVNKNHLGKLPSAMRRALAESEERRQRVRAERAIERLRRRNSLILDSAGEGILGLDTELEFIFINKSGLAMLGYDIKEIIGQHPDKIIINDQNEIFSDLLSHKNPRKAGLTLQSSSFDAIVRTNAGILFPAECTLNPINEEEVTTGYVLTIKDISEQVKSREELKNSYRNIRKLLFDSIHAMSIALEFRDPYTAGHQVRVSNLSTAIANKMQLSENQSNGIYLASIIHDIGKIYIPAEILTRPRRLTDLEFKIIQTHAEAGYQILKDVDYPWPIAETVYQHHERLDGSGYPRGLTGNDIIIEAKIISLADVVEAMVSHRPYRPSMGIEAALEEIKNNSGTLYDSEIVKACLSLFEEGYVI